METSNQNKWLKDYVERIAEHIKAYRQYLGISAEELSSHTEELGFKIPRSSIANIESKKKKTVTSHELSIIAAALGVPPEGLIWDIFKPATLFSYTPTSQQLPGYMVLSEVIKNDLQPARHTKLTDALNSISFLGMAYSQACTKKFTARTYYSMAAENAENLGHHSLAENIKSSIRLKEVHAAGLMHSLTDRVSELQAQGISTWDDQQHLFWASIPDTDFYWLISSYIGETQEDWEFNSTEATNLMHQLGVRSENKVELISADKIPSEPAYQITEQDKIRFFPNYFGD